MNQGATEEVLSLGLHKHLVGTAYLDSPVPEKWKAAYESVPVLAKNYPSKEKLISATPDVVLASYASAFTDKEGVGTREDLAKKGIKTYLSPFSCPDGKKADATFDNVWGELNDVGAIFGQPDAAKNLIAEQKKTLATVEKTAAGKGKKIFWYDSGDKTPFAGAGAGGPQLIMSAVGATNIFGDIDKGWASVSWENVVKANPDVIVFADADWDSAQKKQDYLANDPVLKNLPAVKSKAFIVIPFAESTPGARLVDGAKAVSDGLHTLSAR
ncbi:ABC transporter substrate-binding protein [Devriesea agamarum]|uniref:ABC transporter substrate-binding protein n=1 Tax=Devriesea agamarum TaxID=472569 RepID=UPI001E43418D|nr:ABC transporter substrate-binding protein [Devriesea agamarum]